MEVPHTRIYTDGQGELRWTMKAANDLVIGRSSEGYKDHRDLVRSLEIARQALDVIYEVKEEGDTDETDL